MRVISFFSILKRNFVQLAIAVVIVLSFGWLLRMSYVIGGHSAVVRLEYRVYLENADYTPVPNPQINITAGLQHEDALFKVFKEAEEHLRDQLNSWLTMLSFFGIILGLLVPLVNYLLQRQTLSDERDKMTKDLNSRINEAIIKLDEHVNEAMKKADVAMDKTSELQRGMDALKTANHDKQVGAQLSEMADEQKSDVAREVNK